MISTNLAMFYHIILFLSRIDENFTMGGYGNITNILWFEDYIHSCTLKFFNSLWHGVFNKYLLLLLLSFI